jgi:photosystem II stability/assembly factor-like uncharacterized protein
MLAILTVLTVLLVSHIHAQNFAVFRSMDQGATWTRASSGLPTTARTNAFTATFATATASYIVATDNGIYLSNNEANSWQLAHPNVRAISLASSGNNVFAGTDKSGLLRSTDNGLHWQPIAQSQFRYVRSLVAHNGVLYAGTDTQGVYASTDNGDTWQPLSSGLPAQAQVFSMTTHQGALYAGLYRNGLYRLDPQLKIWTKVGNVVPLALASSGDALFAGHNPGGIQQKTEASTTWSSAKLPYAPNLGNAPVWELAATKRLALAGVAANIYRSTDHGNTWTTIEKGIPPGMTGIAFLIHNNLALAAGSAPLR